MSSRKTAIVLFLMIALSITGCAAQESDSTLANSPSTQPSQTTAPTQTTAPAEVTDPTQVTDPADPQPTTAPQQSEETQPTSADPTEPAECVHSYQTEAAAATCTEDGYTNYTCTLCGDSYRTTEAATGHSYGGWSTVKAATCTEKGTSTRTCGGCGKSESKTVPASGHSYGTGSVIKEAASCSAMGTIRYSCKSCGSSYTTNYQGSHTFGEPYKTMFSGIQMACTGCGYTMTDFYTWRESDYSSCDQTAALYCDTIRLKESTYTGALSTWSEDWLEWHDLILDVLQAYGRSYGGSVTLGFTAELSDYGDSLDAFMSDYNAFLDAFSAFYNWRPVTCDEPYVEDGTVSMYYDTGDLYPLYSAGTNSLSSSRKTAITNDLVSYYIHQMGLRDGMQQYNSIGKICDFMYYRLLCYDYTYHYNSAFRGLTGRMTMCQGYSEVFKLFCDYCNIPCEIVEGTMFGEAHAWNRVTFSDGTVRYVDVTNLGYDYYILIPWETMSYSHTLKG